MTQTQLKRRKMRQNTRRRVEDMCFMKEKLTSEMKTTHRQFTVVKTDCLSHESRREQPKGAFIHRDRGGSSTPAWPAPAACRRGVWRPFARRSASPLPAVEPALALRSLYERPRLLCRAA